jgi:hypothetical protein
VNLNLSELVFTNDYKIQIQWRSTTYPINVHCRKIYNLCVRSLETGRKAFQACFAASVSLYLRTMCVYCVLSCNAKQSPKQLPNCLIIVSIVVKNVFFLP